MTLDADEVVREFAPALARVAASYERDPALRDELLQEVLIAVVSSLPRLKQAGSLKPFVFRVAHNRCLTHVTQRIRERANQEPLDELAANTTDQEQALIERERSHRLLEAIRQLALPYRQVMTLILEDMSYDEIAEALAISVANVGVRVNRAKQQLKVLLNHE
jgi:RNA polymerase sigma-70 factor (ECF subfamily)